MHAASHRGSCHTGQPRSGDLRAITPPVGYSLNRSCPAQRVALGRSDLAELNQRPGPITFSYRSCSTYVNSPDRSYVSALAWLNPTAAAHLTGGTNPAEVHGPG